MLLSACSSIQPEQEVQETFDILSAGKPVPLAVSQGLSLHRRFEGGLSVQSLDSVDMKTIEAIDFKGEPFVNITFSAPKPIDDLWSFAATLSGDEWSTDDFMTPWTTTITGASTVRDVFVTSNEGLGLLQEMYRAVQAMGGVGNLKDVVAYDLQNFVLRDTQDRLWSVNRAAMLTAEETKGLKEIYDAIYEGNNTPAAEEMYEELWEETLEEAELQPQSFGYNLADLTASDGSLDLKKVKAAIEDVGATAALTPQTITDGDKNCFLFVCTAYQYGQLGSTPYKTGGLQATQGGFEQRPSDYDRYDINGGRGFNYLECLYLNGNFVGGRGKVYSKPLGCAPSAFIGLVGRKFNNGATIDGYRKNGPAGKNTLVALKKRMVDPVGDNGRPRIAQYMGTCYFGGGGLTYGNSFKSGANKYLSDANAKSPTGNPIRLQGNVSHYAGNVFGAASTKADMIMQEVGRDNNPVVAEYFLGDRYDTFVEGHFAPIAQYWIRHGASAYVDVKTTNHSGRWYSLSGGWGTERGVFYID